MSSNLLIMGYGGGDFIAAGCRAGGRAAALSLCFFVCAGCGRCLTGLAVSSVTTAH